MLYKFQLNKNFSFVHADKIVNLSIFTSIV